MLLRSNRRLVASCLAAALAGAAPQAARAAVHADQGTALYLDGTGGYSGGAKPFDPSAYSGTAMIWFYATSVGSAGESALISQSNATSGTGTGRRWLFINNGKLATELGGA